MKYIKGLLIGCLSFCLFACGSGKGTQTETNDNETTEKTEIEEENTESEGEEEPAEEEKTVIEESDTFAVGKVEDGKYINEFIGFVLDLETSASTERIERAEELYPGHYRTSLDGDINEILESEDGLVELLSSDGNFNLMLSVHKSDAEAKEYADQEFSDIHASAEEKNQSFLDEETAEISCVIGNHTWVGYEDFYELGNDWGMVGTVMKRSYYTAKDGYIYVLTFAQSYQMVDNNEGSEMYEPYRELMDSFLNNYLGTIRK